MRDEGGAGNVGRVFVIVPAAGRSRRMGCHKLLLEFAGETLIRRLVGQLQGINPAAILLLIRADDAPLLAEARRLPVIVETAETDTPDMRASVERLSDVLGQRYQCGPNDGWMLIPADHPVVEDAVLRKLLAAWRESPDSIVVPVESGRRGHPTIFPGIARAALSRLPSGVGINQLARSGEFAVREVPVAEPSIHWDLDTPADVERFRSLSE